MAYVNPAQSFVNQMLPYSAEGPLNPTNVQASYADNTPTYTAPSSNGSNYVDPNAKAKSDLLAALASQENDVQSQIGRLGRTRDVGLGNIKNAYTKILNVLDDQKARGERDYNTNTTDTIRGYGTARNDVASGTRARLDSVRQLLGASGSGNSSAALYAAPYAAVREGTQRLQPVQETYSTNRRNLDVSWSDLLRDYKSNQGDAREQRFRQEQNLKAKIAQTRANLLDQLDRIGVERGEAAGDSVQSVLERQADRRRQINNLLDDIVGYGREYSDPTIRVKNIKYAAPSLGAYSPDQAAPIISDVPGAEDADPYLAPILEREDEENLLAGLA